MKPGSLRNCLRAFVNGERTLPPLDTEGWAMAQAHRLAGTLYHMQVPLGHVERHAAKRTWVSQAAAHVRRVAVLAERWPADAPPPLVFKGGDLVENLYRDPGARRMSDLDLLLPEAAHAGALAALRPWADRCVEPRTECFLGEAPYEVALHFGEVVLELHQAPQPRHRGGPRAEDLYARSVPGRLAGLDVRYPSARDRLLLWLTNQAKGSFQGDLADLLDLCLILRALPTPCPWMALAEDTRAAGLGRPLQLAVRRLERSGLWPEPLPVLADWDDRLADALLPDLDTPAVDLPTWRFQALKLWLAGDAARTAIASRLVATAWRRAYSQVSGTKTMSPG